mgnify:FL=1
MIYTAPGYWSEYGSTKNLWAEYPLWQAQYNQGKFDIIHPWGRYDFLQWTQTGKGVDYGVRTDGEIACELNYYYGTAEQFADDFSVVENPVNPNEPPSVPIPSDPAGDFWQGYRQAMSEVRDWAGSRV